MVRLSIISIALAVATMEISLSFVQGFETEISNKVVGFGSHVLVTHYTESSYNKVEVKPISLYDTLVIDRGGQFEYRIDTVVNDLQKLENVKGVSPYIHKAGLLQSSDYYEAVLLKGVQAEYQWDFLEGSLLEGSIPDFHGDTVSREILISNRIARKLDLQVGDKGRFVFFPMPIKRRPVRIAGIFETGMEEFDNSFVICDIRTLRGIWGWEDDQISGIEVNLENIDTGDQWYWNFSSFPFLHQDTLTALDYANIDIARSSPPEYKARPITWIFPEIFDWLDMQHQNVWVILILMMVVAIINMTSVILILVIERTYTVGILKAMGLANHRIQRMFVFNAFFLILIGVLAGNLLGLGLLASQDLFGWLKVNQDTYFIETVPVAWVWVRFILVNIGVTLICGLAMFLPTIIINHISPVKAIRFE